MHDWGRTIWKDTDNPFHLFFEPNLQYPVGLVDDQGFQVSEDKSLCVLYDEGMRGYE